MATMTKSIMKHDFDHPDERREFGHGHVDVVHLGDTDVARLVFEKGWRWSEDLKPIVKTESCQVHHVGYLLAGTLRTRMDDGTELDMKAGEVADIPPGHDGWVVGDETVVFVQFTDVGRYAKKA